MAQADIDQLRIEVEASAGQASSNLSRLASDVRALKSAVKGAAGPVQDLAKALYTLRNVGSMASVGAGMRIVAESAKEMAGVKISESVGNQLRNIAEAASMADPKALSAMAVALRSVQGVMGGRQAGAVVSSNIANQMSAIAASSAELAGVAPQMRESAGAVGAVSSMVNRLASLPKISSNIGNQITKIAQGCENLSRVDLPAAKVRQVAEALSQLAAIPKNGLSSTVSAMLKLPQAAQALHDMDFAQLAEDCRRLSDALADLPERLANVAAGMRALTKANAAANKYERMGGGSSLVSRIAKIAAQAYLVREAARAIGTAVRNANEYVEDMNLFSVAMGEFGQRAFEFGQRVSEAMGINVQDWAKGQGVFMTMARGMGVATDSAAVMSQQLTQLSYDLASYYNIDVATAMEKVQAGLSGQLRPLRELGYDLSEARLKQDALAWGIEKSIEDMTQAEKAMLRYREMLSQVSWAQGDMARTLTSPANQLRVFQATMKDAVTTIGKALLPAMRAIMPVAIAVAQVVARLANMLAELTGGAQMASLDFGSVSVGDAAGAIDDYSDSVGDAADATEGAGDAAQGANDAYEELKRTIMGFDELNVLKAVNDATASPSGSGGGGGGKGSGGGGGGLADMAIPTYDFIGDAKNAYSELADAIMAFVERAMGLLAPFAEYAKSIFDAMALQVAGLPFAEAFQNALAGAIGAISAFAIEAAGILAPLWIAFNVPETVTQALNTFAGMMNALAGAVEVVGEAFRGFSDSALVPLAAWLGDELREVLQFVLDLMDDWARWFADNADEAYRLGDAVGSVLGPVLDLVAAMADLALGALGDVVRGLSDGVQGLADAWLSLPKGVHEAITAFALWKVASRHAGDAVAWLQLHAEALDINLAKGLGLSVPKLSTAFAGLAADAALQVTAFSEVASSSGLLSAALGMLETGGFVPVVAVVGIAIAAVAALATVIHSVRVKFDEWRENLSGATGIAGVLGGVVAVVSYLLDIVDDLIIGVVNIARAFADWVMDATPVGLVLHTITDALGGVFGIIANVVGGFREFTETLLGTNAANAEAREATAAHDQALAELNAKLEQERQRIAETQQAIVEYEQTHAAMREAMELSGISSSELATILEAQGTSFDELKADIESYIDTTTNGFDRISEKSHKTFDELAENLAQNLADMQLWSSDMLEVESRWGKDFADYIRQNLGPEYAAALRDELADPSSTNLDSMYASWAQMQSNAANESISKQVSNYNAMRQNTGTFVNGEMVDYGTYKNELVALNDQLWGEVSTTTQGGQDALSAALANGGAAQVASAQQTGTDVVRGLDISQAASEADASMAGYASSIESGASGARTALQSFSSDVESYLEVDTTYIGYNIPAGLGNGIYENASYAFDAASYLANGVNDIMGSVMVIGSPSKLMEKYGRWYDEGLANGIEAASKLPATAAADMANGVADMVRGATDAGILDVRSDVSLASTFGGTLDIDYDRISQAVADGIIEGSALANAGADAGDQRPIEANLVIGRDVFARVVLDGMRDLDRRGEVDLSRMFL